MGVSNYTNELKDQVIKEVQETGSIQVVAKKHGLIPRTVHNWMHGFKTKDKMIEQKKMRELTREVVDLRLQNELLKDLLKKTVQVFGSGDKRS